MQFLTEEEYLDAQDRLPQGEPIHGRQRPQQVHREDGCGGLLMLLQRLDLDAMSYDLRDQREP